jgi:hypothetical protein
VFRLVRFISSGNERNQSLWSSLRMQARGIVYTVPKHLKGGKRENLDLRVL